MEPISLMLLLGAAAASSAASVYNNRQNIKYANEVNSESVALANTAHQREVRDLKAAGLNPILSAQGSGANTPHLQTPALSPIDGSVSDLAGDIASSANGMRRAEVDYAKADADMLSRENKIQRHSEDAMSEAYRRQMQADISSAEAEERASVNQTIDESARHEALVGEGDRIYSHGKEVFNRDGSDYHDLVRMYKRQIENASWSASGWKRGIDTAGSIVDLVGGARNAVRKDVVRGVKSGNNKSGNNKSGNNKSGNNKSGNNKSRKRRLKAFDDALGVKIYE